jgi:hypothetical protein
MLASHDEIVEAHKLKEKMIFFGTSCEKRDIFRIFNVFCSFLTAFT